MGFQSKERTILQLLFVCCPYYTCKHSCFMLYIYYMLYNCCKNLFMKCVLLYCIQCIYKCLIYYEDPSFLIIIIFIIILVSVILKTRIKFWNNLLCKICHQYCVFIVYIYMKSLPLCNLEFLKFLNVKLIIKLLN